ncbi:unnamed protein product [Aphanomyces euteiches]|uniref:Uncharacterized protein n=1 Tax=Aphanomyces euteiches TaxID=100861 RepID=A0A6G0XA45_9STRA|nr:hypothetical protein Ae201684_006990 [Aphanomyces euteiches]KAH9086743.1 hypothetical protein Ae201684P_000164 [Aphanomyces euteiches]KAH9133376.1 hypothetical protein AeRB84_020511 [Aphanomyces euteiches]
MTRALLLAFHALASILSPASTASISAADALQLLNGRGPAISSYKTPVDLDSLLTNFPSCDNKCTGSTPCGTTSIATLGKQCTAPTTRNNGIPYCLDNFVCCNPSACRQKTQLDCTYSSTQVASSLNALSYKSALSYLAYIGASGNYAVDVDKLSSLCVSPPNDQRCVSQCNGWNNKWACPSSCQCTNASVPSLVVGQQFRCLTAGGGYASPVSRNSNGIDVCPLGSTCAVIPGATAACVTEAPKVDVDVASPAQRSSTAAPSSNTDNKKTIGIAVGSACGAAVGLLGLAYYFMRKPKQVELETNDHYHEAPNGA